MPRGFSIAVLGAEPENREAVVAALVGAGFDKSFAIEAMGRTPSVDLVVVTGTTRASLVEELREHREHADTCLLVVCDPEEDADAFLALGADDVIWAGAPIQFLQLRIHLAYQRAAERRGFAELARFQQALLHTRSLIAQRGDGADVLREILLMAARLLGFDRGSLMTHVESSSTAFVVAATDDPTLSQFRLAIADYPEVNEAIRAGTPLIIDDVSVHPATKPLAAMLMARKIRSMAIFPVSWKGRSMGALLFRKESVGIEKVSENAKAFGTLLAAQLAAQLRDSKLFDRLGEEMRDQTRRLSRAGYEAERRERAIESLGEYFEASGEAIFVIDLKGVILFVNGTAESLTGFAADGLVGTSMTELLPADFHPLLDDIVDAVAEGNLIEPVDMALRNTSDTYLTVSVSTSSVLSKHGAVIMGCRDVSRQRSLEAQLRQSNEFLSNLIDSAVDAIIAVDMRGRVIIFNKGAEQLFGYRAEQVVGKRSVSTLYPEGVARQVMRMLRSPSYGGVGRLEQIRREVLIAGGELVPVNMTASIVYEDEREVATVGIFSDLRDRIRIEQRLLQAQDKIQEQEQRSMLAKLAGAAAHELNQPLTSIIGYAQLLQRTSDLEPHHLRYTETIVEEAERMAEIVKKIGRITHYETVAYVGSANIVDIDRSVQASESAPVPALLYDGDEATARVTFDQIAETHEEELSRYEDHETPNIDSPVVGKTNKGS